MDEMDEILQKFQDLKIQLKEITSATNNFDETNCIGRGGFGKVYKGSVSHSKGQSIAAIKRLDRRSTQGGPEFLKEIMTLSRYKHENLISLLGFCYEGNEMILVYEHASRGSLDCYLKSPGLTWSQRIKICLDAATGLCYLHDPRGMHQRVIHCDVKAANILLDDHWIAKVADFGLSLMGPANEQQSTVITFAAGTPGYIDPLYRITNTLTKESDVYSFGVVLFEVLSGRKCCTYINGRGQIVVPSWIESYKQKKLNDIIFKDPKVQGMDQNALEIFSDIAYQCLEKPRKDRPKMAQVVMKLEDALECQQVAEIPELGYQELRRGPFFLNDFKTYLSLNKEREDCVMISVAECLEKSKLHKECHDYESRFNAGTYISRDGIFKTCVTTQFLSPGITYTVNLVFKFEPSEEVRKCYELISLKYKLQGDTESSISHLAHEREDGWWMAELYQFTSYRRFVHLQVLFEGFNESYLSIEVKGIEFQPLEKVYKNQSILDDSDAKWEENLPTNYKDIMKGSVDTLLWTRKKEGFFINDDDDFNRSIWFFLGKNGKKCYMQSAAHIWQWRIRAREFTCESLPESRFGKALRCDYDSIRIATSVEYEFLSYETTYAMYLVYKLPKDQCGFQAPVRVYERICHPGNEMLYIYLVGPQTPVIRPEASQNTHNPTHRPQIKGLPQQRTDGWMEVQIWEFRRAITINIDLMMTPFGYEEFNGLIIEGIEFRPI